MKDILFQALIDSARLALALAILFAAWYVVLKCYLVWRRAWDRLWDHLTFGRWE